jgi:formate/nitrite transporter FocA (FNT family)
MAILARQQLFTENALTGIIPLLSHRNLATLKNVARLWLVVLVANLAGAIVFSAVVANTNMFDGRSPRSGGKRSSTRSARWCCAASSRDG